MINDINYLILVGTLGDDSKLMRTKSDEPMAILNLAISSEWMEGSEHKRKTLWNKVFFFGGQALGCEHYKKGMKVHITAEVAEKQFTEGEKKIYKTIITGQSVWVADLGKDNRPSQEPNLDETSF